MFPSRRITLGGDVFRDEFSLAFDGSNDYIVTDFKPDYIHTNATMAMWIKMNDFTEFQTMGAHGNKRWYMGFEGTAGFLGVADANNQGSPITITPTPVAGQWIHYAVTAHNGTATLYINGVAQGTMSYTQSSGSNPDAGFLMGARWNANNDDVLNEMNCNISEVVQYEGAFSATEIKALYNGREPYNHAEGIRPRSLKAWWRMGDGTLDGSSQITGNTDDSSQDNIISDEVDSSLGAELYTPANSMSTNEADDQSTGLSVISGATVADETSIVSGGSSRSLKYTSTGGTDGVTIDLTSDIDLTVGSVYKVSVDARHIGSGGQHSIRLAEHSGAGTTGETLEIVDITSGMTTFVTYTAYFIHSDTTTRYFGARETSGNDDGGLYLDNLSVRQVNGNAGIMNNMDYSFEGDTPS